MAAREGLSIFWPSALLLVSGLAGIASPQLLPGDGERVAVIAPGTDVLSIVAAADGKALAATSTGIVAMSGEPGFTGRLYRSGAWLVLRFDGLLGCLNSTLKDSDNERG